MCPRNWGHAWLRGFDEFSDLAGIWTTSFGPGTQLALDLDGVVDEIGDVRFPRVTINRRNDSKVCRSCGYRLDSPD